MAITCAQCGTEGLTTTDAPPTLCPQCGSTVRNIPITPNALRLEMRLGDVTTQVSPPEWPGLLMQAIVQRGPRTDDGHLVAAVLEPWFDIVAGLQRDPSGAFQIPWYKWEEIIAGAYQRAGAEVVLTPRSGDLGRDVIATFRGTWTGTVRVLDSVKAYKPGHLVTHDDARALLGVVQADDASKGVLTTTSDFAPGLREDRLLKPLIGPRIELVNGIELLKKLAELSRK